MTSFDYRINKERTKIIGAICGLGYADSTSSAILPEHDMEVAFDVEFSRNDVSDVSKSRDVLCFVSLFHCYFCC